MDKLEAMQVYVCVVDTHSFIRAAEVLGVPRSTVSRVVKELESWLKIQLLQRTTRKLSVTAEGRRYYEECKRVLADIAAMESSFPGRAAQPKGRFKVGDAAISRPALHYSYAPGLFAPVSGAGADTLFQR
ncbi:transcriptional regulator [Salmonella enterica subsp. enterica]|uniref:Transcriptional regulator n=1 Tax=Salmonella enterica I TaxID=59201 RepID=A0A447N9T3_SALET|nr:transcriptional regulator [Salmonella enterica subsp. enterica]